MEFNINMNIKLGKAEFFNALDWIPGISTGTGLYHIFSRCMANDDVIVDESREIPHCVFYKSSEYSLYRHRFSLVENILLLIPIVNIGIKILNYYSYNKALSSVKLYGENLKSLAPFWTRHEGIVTEAVKQNGYALRFAPDNFRGKINIVLEAVKQNGLALEYASDPLKDNIHIVYCAYRHNPFSINLASERLKIAERYNRDVSEYGFY